MIDHDRIAKLILETFQPPGITKEEERELKKAMEYWDKVYDMAPGSCHPPGEKAPPTQNLGPYLI